MLKEARTGAVEGEEEEGVAKQVGGGFQGEPMLLNMAVRIFLTVMRNGSRNATVMSTTRRTAFL